MAAAAEILGDKWTLLILREAFYGVLRYDDMREDLGAPRSMLTDRLTKLVDRGLMKRHTYQEPGSRTRNAYVLTASGRALAPTFIAMTQWGEDHLFGEVAPVEIRDSETGRLLKVKLVDSKHEIVDANRARLVKRKR